MHIFSFHNLLVILYHLQAENYNKTKNNHNNRNRHLILCISSSSLYDSAIINGCEFNNNIINLVFLLFVVAFHFSFFLLFAFRSGDFQTQTKQTTQQSWETWFRPLLYMFSLTNEIPILSFHWFQPFRYSIVQCHVGQRKICDFSI